MAREKIKQEDLERLRAAAKGAKKQGDTAMSTGLAALAAVLDKHKKTTND